MLTQDKRGASAMHISNELNRRFTTVRTMPHELLRALANNGDDHLGGVVEVYETYYRGKGGPGSARRSLANDNKMMIVMLMEHKPARKNQTPRIKKIRFVVGSAKLAMIVLAASGSIGAFLRNRLSHVTNMLTDGWSGYFTHQQDFKHETTIQVNQTDAKPILPLVHLQYSNLKPWLNGAFHGISPKHLPTYLQKWNYRFNRRSIITVLFRCITKER